MLIWRLLEDCPAAITLHGTILRACRNTAMSLTRMRLFVLKLEISFVRKISTHLVQAAPDYAPARTNLVILHRWSHLLGNPSGTPNSPILKVRITASHAAATSFFDR